MRCTVLCVLSIYIAVVTARCSPGVDWQIAGAYDDFGADSFTTAYINMSFVDSLKRFHTFKSEVGKFGDGPVGPASGVLIHVASSTGRNTGCESPFWASVGQIPTHEPWIALIQRGQCNFEVKVDNAFKQNAAAVIVYNDRESPTLDKMKLTSSSRNMSAIFTFKWKGEELARLVDSGTKVYVNIAVATHCTKPNAHINRTSVLFVSISFIVLMIISISWLGFYYIQRFRYMHAKDRLSKRLCSAAKKALSKIPTKQVNVEDREALGDECCAICIEPYRVTDDLRILPCSHEFHKGCIDPWLLEHRTCPMCKMDILKHYGFVFTGSQESILQVEEDELPSPNRQEQRQQLNEEARGGVRSEPVSRVNTPTLQVGGQFYTLQSSRAEQLDSQCCSMCPHRSGRRPCVSIHVPRPASCQPDLDGTKLLLDNECYYDSPSPSSPNLTLQQSGTDDETTAELAARADSR